MLEDAASLENHDLIGALNRRQVVGNQNPRAPLQELGTRLHAKNAFHDREVYRHDRPALLRASQRRPIVRRGKIGEHARRLGDRRRGHRGVIIEGDPSMPVEEATRRRDFTINAILQDPLTGEIIDPFDGRADIDRGILRAVSRETFPEDSLRVLRAAQFSAGRNRRKCLTPKSQ